MLDPNDRISVDDALNHPYVNVWYDESEVKAPPPDKSLLAGFDEDKNYNVNQWKEMIWNQVISCKGPRFPVPRLGMRRETVRIEKTNKNY